MKETRENLPVPQYNRLKIGVTHTTTQARVKFERRGYGTDSHVAGDRPLIGQSVVWVGQSQGQAVDIPRGHARNSLLQGP